MIIFYIKMKTRAGGGALGQQGGDLGQQGAPPAIPLYGKHYYLIKAEEILKNQTKLRLFLFFAGLPRSPKL